MIFALCLACANTTGWFLLQQVRRRRHQRTLDVIVQHHISRGRPRRAKAAELPYVALPRATRRSGDHALARVAA